MKQEYPRKYKGQFALVKIPVFTKDRGYLCSVLEKDGSTTESGFAGHKTEESCWVCCMAHNQRFGYKRKEVEKLIKELRNEGKKTKNKKDKKTGQKLSDSEIKGKGSKGKEKSGKNVEKGQGDRKKAKGKPSKGKKDKKAKAKDS